MDYMEMKNRRRPLGASYDELEWAMLLLNQESQQDDFTERQKQVFDIYKN
jgi:NAD+ synthase